MPVSTFSSASTAVRSPSRTSTIARWNSTRERVQEDERRVSVSEINEMDGTTLYERGDWPLNERTISPEPSPKPMSVQDEIREGDHRLGVVDTSNWVAADWVVERDVSDIDEEEEPPFLPDDGRHSSVYPEVQGDGEVHTGLEHAIRQEQGEVTSPTATSSIRGRQQPDFPSPQHSSKPEISPIRPDFPQNAAPAVDLSQHLDRIEQQQPTYPRSSQDAGDQIPQNFVSQDGTYLQDHQTSQRDAQSLTPMQWQSETTESEQTPYYSFAGSPQANGITTPPGSYARPSSIMKGSPPSASSRRGSMQNTTHVPHKKDHVRYSWQSVQDDEPNRPRINVIKLISDTATASAGPQGEAFAFSISPGGKYIAVYNSVRLYTLQVQSLPHGVSRDYALKRRPLAVELVDDGCVMAILADAHTVNVYTIRDGWLRRARSVKLDYPAHCIALAPTGGLLAAAYPGGVEVFSLADSALPTDRRSSRSQQMDRLTFSADGSTLLGTTTRIGVSSTVSINVPVFPAAANGVPTHEELKEAWSAVIPQTQNIHNSSHAVFLRENMTECTDRVFAWNGSADTFGILNTTDLQYGNIDFPVVISPPLSTCGGLGAAIHSCPAIDETGDTVAMIVNDRTIRLYIVPHKAAEDETTVEAHSIDHELDEGYGCPFSDIRWYQFKTGTHAPLYNNTVVHGRLIVTSPGSMIDTNMDQESLPEIEAGRIIMFDFGANYHGLPGQNLILPLGRGKKAVPLEEDEIDLSTEVALVRRRTVNQSKSGGLSQRPPTLGRAATTKNVRNNMRSPHGIRPGSVVSIQSMQSDAARSLPDLLETNEAIDEPFSNTAPRSYASLQRAASNAQRHRFQTLEERNQERVSVDSNGNFLPLPEYTEEPNAPLPSRFRQMAGLDGPAPVPPRPAVVTGGDSPNAASASVPMTAPAVMAGNFSAEQAFATAIASASSSQGAGRVPPRPWTRNLERAYKMGPPPANIGDWENVMPIQQGNVPNMGQNSSIGSPSRSNTLSREDTISPMAPTAPQSPFGRAQNSRHSLNAAANLPLRPASTASSFGPGASIAEESHSHLPPHMQAFRKAAAANANLFPPNQPADRVPVPNRQSAGAFAHPITAWHPPAPSVMSAPLASSSRGHSRKGSLTSRSAFASTQKAKRLGFFKRKKDGGSGTGGEEVSINDDSRSMMTWMTGNGGEKKCSVM